MRAAPEPEGDGWFDALVADVNGPPRLMPPSVDCESADCHSQTPGDMDPNPEPEESMEMQMPCHYEIGCGCRHLRNYSAAVLRLFRPVAGRNDHRQRAVISETAPRGVAAGYTSHLKGWWRATLHRRG